MDIQHIFTIFYLVEAASGAMLCLVSLYCGVGKSANKFRKFCIGGLVISILMALTAIIQLIIKNVIQ